LIDLAHCARHASHLDHHHGLMGLVANIGFATSVCMAVAMSIGAGALVGGFVAATVAAFGGRSRKAVESTALRDGYLGGAGGLFCLIFDILMKYSGI
jgi:hypothetical protein